MTDAAIKPASNIGGAREGAGRPTVRTAFRDELYFSVRAGGNSIVRACTASGYDYDTVMKWRKNDDAWMLLEDAAQDKWDSCIQDVIHDEVKLNPDFALKVAERRRKALENKNKPNELQPANTKVEVEGTINVNIDAAFSALAKAFGITEDQPK